MVPDNAGAQGLASPVEPRSREVIRALGQDEQTVRHLLRKLGDDPDRPGLRDTPRRFIKAMIELAGEGGHDCAEELTTRFEEPNADEMVLLRDVAFTSLCEHHLLPFTGTATVAYIPAGTIIGLSKLARLVTSAARRLQVQERMTWQIADAIMRKLRPVGAACIVRANHACLGCRGAKQPGATMVTSTLLGVFRDNAEARREFLGLAQ